MSSVLDHMSREQLMQVQSAARIYQERADTALSSWDIRAPAPVLGQPIEKYRRDLAVMLKRQLPEGHQLRKVQFRRLDDVTLDIFERQLYPAVRAEAHNPMTVPVGEFRRVVEIDQNGAKMVKWIGQQSFVREMGRPGRRVVSFMHRYDSTGRAFR